MDRGRTGWIEGGKDGYRVERIDIERKGWIKERGKGG